MKRAMTILACTVAATSLSGCRLFAEDCHAPQDYQTATSVPSLKVPDGLNAPQTRGALKIPDVPTSGRPRGAGSACLDEPPSFYPNRPKPGLKPGDKDKAKAKDKAQAKPAEAPKPPPPITNNDDPKP